MEDIGYLQRLLEASEIAFGPDHPDTLDIRGYLAQAFVDDGQKDEAIALYRALLVDEERVLGPGQPDALKVSNNLANTLFEAG